MHTVQRHVMITLLIFSICAIGCAQQAGCEVDDFTPARTVTAATVEELQAAVDDAQPGDLIELTGDAYSMQSRLTISVEATAENPVVIQAADGADPAICGNAGWLMKDCKHVCVRGLQFVHLDATGAMAFDSCQHCRFTRNVISLQERDEDDVVHWLTISGNHSRYNRVDHNLFYNKSSRGNMCATYGSDESLNRQSTQYDRIDHNYFLEFHKGDRNGFETIRLGQSTFSHSYGYISVDHNLFERCSGEGEIISVKCNGNILNHNTFVDCFGMLTLRNCHDCTVNGNYFFNPEDNDGRYGIRIYGQNQRVINNYMENLSSPAIIVRACDIKRRTKPRHEYGEDEEWGGYQRIVNATVANNTIVDCAVAFEIGDESENRPLAPVDCTIANNLVVADKTKINRLRSLPENWTWANNIIYSPEGTIDFGLDIPESGLMRVDPKLIRSGRVWKLSSTSPAISAGVSVDPPLEIDFEKQERLDTPDIGADEFTFSRPDFGPLTPDDVGPDAR